jgi:hypothetical protein
MSVTKRTVAGTPIEAVGQWLCAHNCPVVWCVGEANCLLARVPHTVLSLGQAMNSLTP